jgi:hypothetical protein
LDEKIAVLESLTEQMEYVSNYPTPPYYVLTSHNNLFVDYVATAVDLLKELYDLFKSKTGRELWDVELWIGMAESRAGMMRKVRFGDVVATKDHNLVIDTLKPVEVALQVIEANV